MTSASTDQWKRTYDAVMWTVFILSEYTLASIVNNLNVIGIHRLMKKNISIPEKNSHNIKCFKFSVPVWYGERVKN